MSFISKYIHNYRKEAVLAPLCKLFEATLELFIPLIIAQMIDRGITSDPANTDKGFILKMGLALIGLAATGLVISVTGQFFAAKAATGFAASVRRDLFSHIMGFSYSSQDSIGTDTLITRLTADINRLQSGVNMTLRLLLRSPFVILGAIVMSFTVDVNCAMVLAIVVPLLSIVIVGLVLITLPLYEKNQKKVDALLLSVKESLDGIRVIRAFTLEKENAGENSDRNNAVYEASRHAGHISAIQNPLTLLMINVATILLIYKGAIRVDEGILTQGQVVALVNYTSQILVELVKTANMMITLTAAIASGKRVTAILDSPTEEPVSRMPAPTDEKTPLVSFDNVSFKYHTDSDPAVINLSFSACKGEFIGIIGSTGCGKTTVANLITGAYKPTVGSIDVSGEISVVPQKSVLFSGSIADNLKFGDKNASEEKMWNSLSVADAADFVRQKEGGLNYTVTPGGKNFSGGQRQRLCIARALCKPADILILDDSASALDYATERKLRDNLLNMQNRPLIFWISQRAASIVSADQILVLEDGECVGLGNHETLLEKCETYKEIYESQN